MELTEIISLIKQKKRHGIIKRVATKTGVSQPTVRKYLEGDVISDKALLVISAALEDVKERGKK